MSVDSQTRDLYKVSLPSRVGKDEPIYRRSPLTQETISIFPELGLLNLDTEELQSGFRAPIQNALIDVTKFFDTQGKAGETYLASPNLLALKFTGPVSPTEVVPARSVGLPSVFALEKLEMQPQDLFGNRLKAVLDTAARLTAEGLAKKKQTDVARVEFGFLTGSIVHPRWEREAEKLFIGVRVFTAKDLQVMEAVNS